MTTTALMRYYQQQQRHHHHPHQQHHQPNQSSASPSSTSESRTALLPPVNNINCQNSQRSYNNHNSDNSSHQGARVSPSCSNNISSNGNQDSSINNGFGTGRGRNETNQDNHETNNQRNHHLNPVHQPDPYHNVNNVYNYHNNNLDAFHANLVPHPWRTGAQKISSNYGQNYPSPLWSFTGAQAAAQSAVLVATAQAVEAIQQAEQGSTESDLERIPSEPVPENRRSSTNSRSTRNSTSAVNNSTESSSLTLLGVPTEQNVSDLAKKLLAEASSALQNGNDVKNDQNVRPATITSTTKIVKTTSITSVVNENISQKSDATKAKGDRLENTDGKRLQNQTASDMRNDVTMSSTSSPPENEEKRTTSQTFITLTSCRKTNSIPSDSPPNSSNSSSLKNASSCSTSFTSISASSSSSSTPSCIASTPSVNAAQVFAHPMALLPLASAAESIVDQDVPSVTNKEIEINVKLEDRAKSQKVVAQNDSYNDDGKFQNIKRRTSSDAMQLPNNRDIQKQDKKKIGKSEPEYSKQSKSTESLFSPYNISSNSSNNTVGGNYQSYSHHQPYDVPQHGSHSSQSHFQRSLEQVTRRENLLRHGEAR